MQTFTIRRRSNWADELELQEAAARSTHVGNNEMSDKVRWIRTYVVKEADGRLGSVCIYQGVDEAAIREHAQRSGLSADEILTATKTVIVRDDPREMEAAA
jgi:D-aminopeptidase